MEENLTLSQNKNNNSDINTEYVFSPVNNNNNTFNQNSQNNQNNSNRHEEVKSFSKDEMTTIWELEVWKKSEQTKFKAYLKQLELEYMNKVSDDVQAKEIEREKQIKSMTNDLQLVNTKARKKLMELEARENKVSLL